MRTGSRVGQASRAGVALGALLAVSACSSRAPVVATAPPPLVDVPVMGSARLTAEQLIAWYHGRQPRPAGLYAATVSVEALAHYYVEEGAAEGVAGDVAFVQSIVETGWHRFSGSVPAWMNNFAGIGATHAAAAAARFPDARTGVRAHIQHLRAYADASANSCSMPPLRRPCVDPRFDLVIPKGKAPTWNQMGSGNWASAPGYGASILGLFREALRFHGRG